MEPPGAFEEESAGRRHRRVVAEDVGQGRAIGARRMRPLERLVELLRVAQQDETVGGAGPWRRRWRARSGPPRRRTGRRPRRPSSAEAHSHDVPAARLARPPSSRARTSAASFARVTRGSSRTCSHARRAGPGGRRPPGSPGCGGEDRLSRLPMTLWLVPVIPTRRPAASSVQIIRAPVHVLPEPGGPWMARVVLSRSRASRRAASRSGSSAAEAARRATGPPEAAGRTAGRDRARFGPSASMPWSATHVPSSNSDAWWSVVRNQSSGTIARGCGSATVRRRSTVRLAASTTAFSPTFQEKGRVGRASLLVRRVVDVAATEVEVLLREAVPPGLLPVLLVVHRADRLEQADRSVFLDELLGRQVHAGGRTPTTSTCPRGGASRGAARAARSPAARRPLRRIGRDHVRPPGARRGPRPGPVPRSARPAARPRAARPRESRARSAA